MSNRMRMPLDQERMKLIGKRVFEYRRWETGEDGQRAQSETQAKTKKGVPLWEVTCVSLGEGPELVRVVVQAEEKPDFESGTPMQFKGLDAVVWNGKNGLGADYYANGIENVQAKKAA